MFWVFEMEAEVQENVEEGNVGNAEEENEENAGEQDGGNDENQNGKTPKLCLIFCARLSLLKNCIKLFKKIY